MSAFAGTGKLKRVFESIRSIGVPNVQTHIKGQEVEFLGGNGWLHVYRFLTGKHAGYTFSYEPRWDDMGVGVLPFRRRPMGQIEYMGVYEVRPVHGNVHQLYALTGGYDDRSISIRDCAVKEVKEETGYDVDVDDLIYLGVIDNNKMSTARMTLYAVDVTNYEQGEKTTDGSVGEQDAFATWINLDTLIADGDSLLAKMYLLLKRKRHLSD